MTSSKLTFPRAWKTYGFCAAAVLVGALDISGLPVGTTQYFFLMPFYFGVIGFFLCHLIICVTFVRQHGWKGLLPLFICGVAIPLSVFAGHRLFELRFFILHDRYETVANEIYKGTYHLPLKPEDASLGLGVGTIEEKGVVKGVQFDVVSHGSVGGHAGYLRVYDAEMNLALKNGGKVPGGARWSWASPRGGGWYEYSD